MIFQTEEELTYGDTGAAKSVIHEKKDDQGNVVSKPREDRLLFSPEDHIFAVFDGLGAHGNGDKAAQAARDFFAENVKRIPNDLTIEETAEYFHDLCLEIHNQLLTRAEGRTTMVLAYIYETTIANEKKLITVNIGDSRLYRFRNSHLECLTIDNENPSTDRDTQRSLQKKLSNIRTKQEFDVLPEEEQKEFNKKGGVQALGGEDIVPIIDIVESQENDMLLLTSDGITNNLTDTNIENILLTTHANPSVTIQQLITAAKAVANDATNLRALPDDMTAEIVKLTSAFPKRPNVISPEDDSEAWIRVASEMITIFPQQIQDVRTRLGRELTPSELFYVISNGNVALIEHVEPMYHKVKRARAHLIGTEAYNDFKQLERSQRTNTYDYVLLQRLVTLASIPITSREELDVYATLQQLTEEEKIKTYSYFEAHTPMQIILRSAFSQMVPTFEGF